MCRDPCLAFHFSVSGACLTCRGVCVAQQKPHRGLCPGETQPPRAVSSLRNRIGSPPLPCLFVFKSGIPQVKRNIPDRVLHRVDDAFIHPSNIYSLGEQDIRETQAPCEVQVKGRVWHQLTARPCPPWEPHRSVILPPSRQGLQGGVLRAEGLV